MMDLDDVAALGFLIWLTYTVLSRFLRYQPLRILASVIGLGILTLPLGEQQFLAVMTGQILVLVYDVFVQLMHGNSQVTA